jgi:hypothetical protein
LENLPILYVQTQKLIETSRTFEYAIDNQILPSQEIHKYFKDKIPSNWEKLGSNEDDEE